MTSKEICEAWVRHSGVPEKDVPTAAERFWNADTTGSLFHVYDAAVVLRGLGKLPPEAPIA